MNIKNLTPEEQLQLQTLLNKMNQTIELNVVDSMIEEIIENFDFGKVMIVMKRLNWKYSGDQISPTEPQLIETAKYVLNNAISLRLDEYNQVHHDIPIMASTGGFEAFAYCNEEKTQITHLCLKFVVTDWDSSLGYTEK